VGSNVLGDSPCIYDSYVTGSKGTLRRGIVVIYNNPRPSEFIGHQVGRVGRSRERF